MRIETQTEGERRRARNRETETDSRRDKRERREKERRRKRETRRSLLMCTHTEIQWQRQMDRHTETRIHLTGSVAIFMKRTNCRLLINCYD